MAESTVNAVVSKRFAKRQQMQWTRRGAHMLHDRPHHLVQRWITYRRRYALADLFFGSYERPLPFPASQAVPKPLQTAA